MAQNLEDAGVGVLGWCLILHLVHLIVVPDREDSLAVLMPRVHGRFAQMVNDRLLRSGRLWQNRFFYCALSPSHLRRTLVYVERSPVWAGLVARPEDCKWSSAAAHLGLTKDRCSLLNKEFWAGYGGTDGWAALLGG